MYRIHFDTNGQFVIQILRYWFFWCTIKDAEFETFQGAQHHVDRIGLSQLYRDRSANLYNAYMNT